MINSYQIGICQQTDCDRQGRRATEGHTDKFRKKEREREREKREREGVRGGRAVQELSVAFILNMTLRKEWVSGGLRRKEGRMLPLEKETYVSCKEIHTFPRRIFYSGIYYIHKDLFYFYKSEYNLQYKGDNKDLLLWGSRLTIFLTNVELILSVYCEAFKRTASSGEVPSIMRRWRCGLYSPSIAVSSLHFCFISVGVEPPAINIVFLHRKTELLINNIFSKTSIRFNVNHNQFHLWKLLLRPNTIYSMKLIYKMASVRFRSVDRIITNTYTYTHPHTYTDTHLGPIV